MSWEGNYLLGWHVRDLWLNHSLSWGGCKWLVLCAWGSPVSLWLVVVPEGLSTCHSGMKGFKHRIKWFLAWDDWTCSYNTIGYWILFLQKFFFGLHITVNQKVTSPDPPSPPIPLSFRRSSHTQIPQAWIWIPRGQGLILEQAGPL